MTFTNKWFDTSGKANFEKYLAHLKGKTGLRILEIGCFEGRATKWLVENILSGGGGEVLVIDTFEGSMEHQNIRLNLYSNFVRNVKDVYPENIRIRRGKSQEVLREFGCKPLFDFVYIDGSHIASDVLEDAILSFRLLKTDGILIFDDYGWDKYEDKTLNPRLGINCFLEAFKGKYRLLFQAYQVGIVKIL